MQSFRILDEKTSKRIKDDNGYLIIKNNPIAKAGVFEYLLSELKSGVSEADDRIVKVYRPFDDLVKVKDTFANKPIKFNHKWVGEDDNLADGAIGSSIGIDEDNLMLTADIIIYNPKLIKAIEEDNIVELSPGYTGEEELQNGRFNGENYEYIQRIVCVNHLAVVDKGRSGSDLKIQDSKNNIKEFVTMAQKRFKDNLMAHIKRFFDENSEPKKEDEEEIEIKEDDELKIIDEDKREIIREIMTISGKPDSEFKGGEDEKVKTIAELAEKLAYNPSETEKNDSESESEVEIKEDDEEEIVIAKDKVSAEELAEAVVEATESIIEKKLTEFQDKQRKELKKITDTYAKVSDTLGTTFDYRGMSANDIYKFGYEALSGNTLDKGMDAMTAFTMIAQTKRSNSKFNDVAVPQSKESNILKILDDRY